MVDMAKRSSTESLAEQLFGLLEEERAFVWYGGEYQRAAESEFSLKVGSSNAVMCQSGTAALHLLLHANGCVAGSTVAIPSFAFYSIINVVLAMGAIPFILPVDDATLLIDIERAADEIPVGAYCIVVHAVGLAVDTKELGRRRPDLVMIEDASDAQGTSFNGEQVGYSGVGTAWSFTSPHNEVHSAAVGGMVTTPDGKLASRIRRLCHYGKEHRSNVLGTRLNPLPSEPGFNYIVSELEAVVLLDTIGKAPESWNRRRLMGERSEKALAMHGLRVPSVHGNCIRNFYDVLFWLPEEVADEREDVLDALVNAECPAWTYHSLFELPWLQSTLEGRGCWGSRESAMAMAQRSGTRGLMGMRPGRSVEEADQVDERALSIIDLWKVRG